MKARIKIGNKILDIMLMDTFTAKRIWEVLPYESIVQRWGEEVYFNLPIVTKIDKDAKDIVELGQIAYWIEGESIAIGFGPTPISKKDEIRLISKVNIWANSLGDPKIFKETLKGEKVLISRLNDS